jgi:hypothetical protein
MPLKRFGNFFSTKSRLITVLSRSALHWRTINSLN